MLTSRIWESAERPCCRSESPDSVFTRTCASTQKRAISRTTFAGRLGSETITISTRCSWITRGRSAMVPRTFTPSIMWPGSRGSSSMKPTGCRTSLPAGPRRISVMRCTPACPAPTTTARPARSGTGPSTRSRESRHAKRTPPMSTISHSQMSTMRLRGKRSS